MSTKNTKIAKVMRKLQKSNKKINSIKPTIVKVLKGKKK
jgi:hypothetical protein